jgi:hypothetical protein
MSDDPLVQALHAAISRRSWHVEEAANAIRDDKGIHWPVRKPASSASGYTVGWPGAHLGADGLFY